jgi:hypothetical protein
MNGETEYILMAIHPASDYLNKFLANKKRNGSEMIKMKNEKYR